MSIKGAKTKGNTLSAWYLGGPDEGGISSRVITLEGSPSKASSTGNAAEENGASNTGNTPQGGNNGNTPQEKGAGEGS
jgi:hypothetical protein